MSRRNDSFERPHVNHVITIFFYHLARLFNHCYTYVGIIAPLLLVIMQFMLYLNDAVIICPVRFPSIETSLPTPYSVSLFS